MSRSLAFEMVESVLLLFALPSLRGKVYYSMKCIYDSTIQSTVLLLLRIGIVFRIVPYLYIVSTLSREYGRYSTIRTDNLTIHHMRSTTIFLFGRMSS